MWTITNQQLCNMKETRRAEFERQMCNHIMQRHTGVNESMVKEIVLTQTNHIVLYGFTQMEPIVKFFELSMSYTLIRGEQLLPEIQEILSEAEEESTKIEKIEVFLKNTEKW